MRINHNIMSMNTSRQLGAASSNSAKSMEKLSSGLRINKAGDDAAGLAISEKMRSQIRGLNQASRNAQDGISMIQTAEGALNETQSILQRVRELAVQANNGTNTSDDTQKIQDEIDQLVEEIDGIADRTEFNGKTLLKGTVGLKLDEIDGVGTAPALLSGATIDVSGADANTTYAFAYTDGATSITLAKSDGSLSQTVDLGGAAGAYAAGKVLDFDKLGVKITLGSADTFNSTTGIDIDAATLITENDALIAGKASIQIGANSSQTLDISIADMQASQLGSTVAMTVVDVTSTAQTFEDRLAGIDEAITQVSEERGKLGAYQNRLEHTITNLDTSAENLQAAESRIRDVDMAKEMMEFTKNNILSQAATAMLAQANQAPQGVLQLLR